MSGVSTVHIELVWTCSEHCGHSPLGDQIPYGGTLCFALMLLCGKGIVLVLLSVLVAGPAEAGRVVSTWVGDAGTTALTIGGAVAH